MSLTVNDLADLRQLLIAHPEWRSELRPLILGPEIESLPEIVRDLAEAQRRTEQRLSELAEAQRHTEKALMRLEATMETLVDAVGEMKGRMGQFVGFATEQRYRNTPGSFFGRWIKRPVVADLNDVRDRLEPHLTPDEVDDALLADLIVKGNALQEPRQVIWLVVEVSAVVDGHDIERAVRRSGLFRRAGLAAVPVVAGETTTSGGNEAARDEAVAVLQDGQRLFWSEAAAKWLVS